MSNWERKITRERERQQQAKPSLVAYRTDRFDSHADAALAAARASGCACHPTITTDGDRVAVSHDSWCPLLRSKDHN